MTTTSVSEGAAKPKRSVLISTNVVAREAGLESFVKRLLHQVRHVGRNNSQNTMWSTVADRENPSRMPSAAALATRTAASHVALNCAR